VLIDAFPFFNELDVLEIRLAELAPIVDKFVIVECKETYGGDLKPLYLQSNWSRFKPWHDKIVTAVLQRLEPDLPVTIHEYKPGINASDIRTAGRAREAYARNAMLPVILSLNPGPEDYLSFGDCDEIPRASALAAALPNVTRYGIHRLKQRTFYYNVNTEIDYGRDVCSRARVGRFKDITTTLYDFRMAGNKQPHFPAIEEGGWHFSYFGGDVAKLHEKVAALDPFLKEYQLFGDRDLVQDILSRRDLHRRPTGFSELPDTFAPRASDDKMLPAYFLSNPDKFKHFTADYFASKYAGKF
jgi:beta-1,4-mannosyl-glycoprotein beta-1,4-N-acetylglucosaminyltransferase